MTGYAIHSPNNGELLIKFHDELVKHGFRSIYSDEFHPNLECEMRKRWAQKEGRKVWFYTLSVHVDKDMFFNNHHCTGDYIHRRLTKRNFNSVLNEVLQNFGINV